MSPQLETLPAPSDAESGLRVDLEDLPRWRRRITLTASPDRVRRVREEVARGYAKRLKVPGFRPGHAPADLVRKRFAAEIEEDLRNRLLRTGVEEALRLHRLDPIAPPVATSAEVDPTDAFRAVVEVDVRPDVRLTRTGGFRIERAAPEVDPDAAERLLQRLREEHAEERPVDRAAARGDVVVADVEPLDGPAGSLTEGWRAVLGEGAAPPEVEARLEGAAPGGDVEVQMPAADPGAPPRRFRLHVREVRERVLPPLDDAFAARVSKAATLTELRDRLAGNLREEAAARAERDYRDRLLDAIAEANAVEVPEPLVERWVEGMLSAADSSGPSAGVGRPGPAGRDRGGRAAHAHRHQGDAAEEHAHERHAETDGGYVEEGGGAADRDAEIRRILRPAAEQGLRRMLVIEAVARDAGLDPTEDQVDGWIAERLEPGVTVEETRRSLERSGRLNELRRRLRDENVFRHLASSGAAPAGAGEGGA
jgi:trigger factor